ncbi:hypothetical protein [Altererythrobacter lutimaris]|uniref:Uncharacterized protein n=1 Tax=Altererythrobacter lutimaris TaxID=2743979 RepID=A0A850H9N1_9SPHN|nr:hypothetical protein [Altererythrobacter lutimaris]NVE93651.1 hypothetical protein [Altererythrobacter lutimaris]
MPHLAFTSALLAIANTGAPAAVDNVAIFERAQLTDELAVTSFGIIEDSRCSGERFCFDEDRLVIAAVVHYRGQDREVSLALGEPLRLNGGTLTLTGTATPASSQGAIQLKRYRLDFEFQPDN